MCPSVEILDEAGSSELTLKADRVRASSLKLAVEGVHIPLKSAKLQTRAFFLRDQLNFNQYHWSQDF